MKDAEVGNNLNFRGQREDEDVLLLIHRHPWGLARHGLIAAVGLAVIILAFIFWQLSGPAVWTLFIVGPILLAYSLYWWFVWWNNLYLVTNQRVIVITQEGLWRRRIEDYALDKIQSVASDSGGMAGTILNFGSVMLAIMGIRDQVKLAYVEDPYSVQEKILSAMKKGERVTVHNYTDSKPKRIQN